MCVYTYICIYVCIYIYICMYVCMYICMCIYIYIYIYYFLFAALSATALPDSPRAYAALRDLGKLRALNAWAAFSAC